MADEKLWYVMRVISGQERKIREHLLLEINREKARSFDYNHTGYLPKRFTQ
jgi:transcription antitermination factor NusG